MVRKPVKEEQFIYLWLKQIMQITKMGLISRVRWIRVKHTKQVLFCISTPPDNRICRPLGRWLTKLVVISTYGERF